MYLQPCRSRLRLEHWLVGQGCRLESVYSHRVWAAILPDGVMLFRPLQDPVWAVIGALERSSVCISADPHEVRFEQVPGGVDRPFGGLPRLCWLQALYHRAHRLQQSRRVIQGVVPGRWIEEFPRKSEVFAVHQFCRALLGVSFFSCSQGEQDHWQVVHPVGGAGLGLQRRL